MVFNLVEGGQELISSYEQLFCSSQGNLGIHRVYTETIDPRFYRMGLYAARDIEIGEELLLQKISDIPDCRLMGKLVGAFSFC
jgi:hypothetical protein